MRPVTLETFAYLSSENVKIRTDKTIICADLSINGKILSHWEVGSELDAPGSRSGPVVSSCEDRNKPRGSVKYGEFLDQLSDFKLKEASDAWSCKTVARYDFSVRMKENLTKKSILRLCTIRSEAVPVYWLAQRMNVLET